MLAFIHVFSICIVATMMFVAVAGNLGKFTEPLLQNAAKCSFHRVPYSNMKSVSLR
jgi:hypothetical protein